MNDLEHLAIIMDGNGRWAKRYGKERSYGHRVGAKNVREITKYAAKMGIKYLSLYAFSTENWNRPKTEVAVLMKLLEKYLKTEVSVLKEHNIKFTVIGDISKFSHSLQKEIHNAKEQTAHCTGMTQVVAINYGARDEIIRAINEATKTHQILTPEILENHLDTAGMPPVDLLIRTGGDCRLSNFLLWQAAYAELFFTKTLWPEFSFGELEAIVSEYRQTERRFGAVISE
ncbi:MAG: di-trans,poly-cis-decaprenylcistransferase [Sulfurospirillaceae bacterium]|nr:di-trans,poly-cis-decaprenylcistransferase [Sulfurospirillaceae bacterium]